MISLIFYQLRFIIIIIAFIGFIVMGSVFTYLFDIVFPKSRWFNPTIDLLVMIIRITILGIGFFLIRRWYDKKWGSAIDEYNLGVQLIGKEKMTEWTEEIMNNDEALSKFENAIKKNPYFWPAYFNGANIYYFRKNYDKALEYIKTVIKLKPKFGPAYLHLGKFLQIKEREEIKQGIETQQPQSDLYNEAIEAYKKALKLRLSKEEKLQAHALLSELYLQLGLIDEGEKELNEVLKIDPHNKTAYDYLDELVKEGFIVEKRRWRLFP